MITMSFQNMLQYSSLMANHERTPITFTNITPAVAESIVERARQNPKVTIVNHTSIPGNAAPEVSGGVPYYLKRTREFETVFIADMLLADEVIIIEDK